MQGFCSGQLNAYTESFLSKIDKGTPWQPSLHRIGPFHTSIMGTPNAHTAGIAKAETKFMLIAESGFANGSNPQQKPNRCKT